MWKGIRNPNVAMSRMGATNYDQAESSGELEAVIRECCSTLGWDDPVRGAFGQVIPERAKIVVKPNWVLHANQGSGGLHPLLTHQSVIKSVVSECLKAEPVSLLVGDAPIQMCDWEGLIAKTGMGNWSNQLESESPAFQGLRDFRRTTCKYQDGIRIPKENVKDETLYVLFDLGGESLLEPITGTGGDFRVTSYDPRLMAATHSTGTHKYLIARDVLEADVVINLPKLKTHKKAGISCALKNLVGINGNKEYLPHHRVGGTAQGGDCYPGKDRLKRALEGVLDMKNMTSSPSTAKFLAAVENQFNRALRLRGDMIGVEGAWVGNETVARMTLDLNRILLYGRVDGTMASTVQRRVLNVVDGIVAGQGNGPLANDPLPLGLMIAGENAAAVDHVGARVLKYDPSRIPLLRLAFDAFRWQIAEFSQESIELHTKWAEDVAFAKSERTDLNIQVKHPTGWDTASTT